MEEFVRWYRGPRGVGIKCAILGFNAGVTGHAGPTALVIFAITVGLIWASLARLPVDANARP